MKLTPGSNDPAADMVFTPRDVAKSIIDHFPLSGIVLDAAKGEGAFYDQFPKDVVRRWCEIELGRDFLLETDHVDWVITNPPWSKYRAFARHAYEIADNVAFLVTVTHDLAMKARIRDMYEAGFGIREIFFIDTPLKPWPNSGFQLGVVWKQRGWTGPAVFSRP